jgi:hypothetical protein
VKFDLFSNGFGEKRIIFDPLIILVIFGQMIMIVDIFIKVSLLLNNQSRNKNMMMITDSNYDSYDEEEPQSRKESSMNIETSTTPLIDLMTNDISSFSPADRNPLFSSDSPLSPSLSIQHSWEMNDFLFGIGQNAVLLASEGIKAMKVLISSSSNSPDSSSVNDNTDSVCSGSIFISNSCKNADSAREENSAVVIHYSRKVLFENIMKAGCLFGEIICFMKIDDSVRYVIDVQVTCSTMLFLIFLILLLCRFFLLHFLKQ